MVALSNNHFVNPLPRVLIEAFLFKIFVSNFMTENFKYCSFCLAKSELFSLFVIDLYLCLVDCLLILRCCNQ